MRAGEHRRHLHHRLRRHGGENQGRECKSPSVLLAPQPGRPCVDPGGARPAAETVPSVRREGDL